MLAKSNRNVWCQWSVGLQVKGKPGVCSTGKHRLLISWLHDFLSGRSPAWWWLCWTVVPWSPHHSQRLGDPAAPSAGSSKLTHHLPPCFLKPLLMVSPSVTHLLSQYSKPQGLLWLSYHLPSSAPSVATTSLFTSFFIISHQCSLYMYIIE